VLRPRGVRVDVRPHTGSQVRAGVLDGLLQQPQWGQNLHLRACALEQSRGAVGWLPGLASASLFSTCPRAPPPRLCFLPGAVRVAAKIESGIVWVNCWLHRDLRTAFGGVKDSGVGREGGKFSLEFYSEYKNVCVFLGRP
jgi:hypothetical protein